MDDMSRSSSTPHILGLHVYGFAWSHYALLPKSLSRLKVYGRPGASLLLKITNDRHYYLIA